MVSLTNPIPHLYPNHGLTSSSVVFSGTLCILFWIACNSFFTYFFKIHFIVFFEQGASNPLPIVFFEFNTFLAHPPPPGSCQGEGVMGSYLSFFSDRCFHPRRSQESRVRPKLSGDTFPRGVGYGFFSLCLTIQNGLLRAKDPAGT